ncbi:hypothetical protein RvVAR0630_09670 [Agrobacterium vitis]|uniref:retron Ec78 anti-phage system effector HNH endonuclease PtuB n=1 Tax=Agrobacterium vitis TaxID=373 RepID=UPI0015D94199|nr:retron Ec78 anti-phage system effector HNH endonuclease PtuB [Agrobacterium vitis]BCH58343.1 hypothetical protein RvVAR0630_09670 [Agrobacterium vitis]
MHKLERGEAPTCLSTFDYREGHQWGDLSSVQKAEIWQALNAMQGQRCAYCEKDIENKACHIEHFVQRSRDPALTFDWRNIFGSCNENDSCGKHKDQKATPYSIADLVKPDDEDAEDLIVFNASGKCAPRKDLTERQRIRACETIRIFNLNRIKLADSRRSHLEGYIQTAEDLKNMIDEFGEGECRPLIEEEIRQIAHLPFATAIKHILIGN